MWSRPAMLRNSLPSPPLCFLICLCRWTGAASHSLPLSLSLSALQHTPTSNTNTHTQTHLKPPRSIHAGFTDFTADVKLSANKFYLFWCGSWKQNKVVFEFFPSRYTTLGSERQRHLKDHGNEVNAPVVLHNITDTDWMLTLQVCLPFKWLGSGSRRAAFEPFLRLSSCQSVFLLFWGSLTSWRRFVYSMSGIKKGIHAENYLLTACWCVTQWPNSNKFTVI